MAWTKTLFEFYNPGHSSKIILQKRNFKIKRYYLLSNKIRILFLFDTTAILKIIDIP
jgi:hypothetical protein